MPSQNESMKEVSFKSDNGKVFKTGGKFWGGIWGTGGISKKNTNVTNAIPK